MTDGAVGIILVDDTSLSLGGDGLLTLDSMVYDPNTQDGQMAVGVLQGAFMFISGEVAKTAPEAMIVNTPIGVIGVRGTAAGIKVEPGTGATTAVLIGESNGFVGEITVSSGGMVQTINVANVATTISGLNQPPSSPFEMSPAEFGRTFGGALDLLPQANDRLDQQTQLDANEAYAQMRAEELQNLPAPAEDNTNQEEAKTELASSADGEAKANTDPKESDTPVWSGVKTTDILNTAGWQSGGIEAWGDLGDTFVLELGVFLAYAENAVNIDKYTIVRNDGTTGTLSVVKAAQRDVSLSGQVIDGYIKGATVM